LAASLATAQLFKVGIGQDGERWIRTVTWDLWQHALRNGEADGPTADEPMEGGLDWGRTLLAGVGAIGSALIYLARMEPMGGTLGILDVDKVETSNLNRTPLFNARDVADETLKVDVVLEYLRGSGVVTERFDGWWEDVSGAVRSEPWDYWITLTNEHGVWTELPFLQPPVLLHATTTSGWGIAVGRHAGNGDDCTRCRMPIQKEEFRGPCATGAIANSSEGEPAPRAALPFLSTAAAALLLAECHRVRRYQRDGSPNQVTADLLWGLVGISAVHRGTTPGCSGCEYLERVAMVAK
jgi:hypothetical protein